jgi:hypothetical protein
MPKLTLFFKGLLIDSFPLKDTLVIGRNPNCQIHIDSLSIAPKHAEIVLIGRNWIIRSTSKSESTLINHSPLQEQQRLVHGDHLQIGKYTLSFSEDAVEPDYLPTNNDHKYILPLDHNPKLDRLTDSINQLPEGCIQVLNGQHVGKIIPLQKSLTRLGLTGNQCAIVAHRSDGYYIAHLEGDTPPKVNHTSIENNSIQLKDGQIIELGKTRMRFYEEMLQPVAISNSA